MATPKYERKRPSKAKSRNVTPLPKKALLFGGPDQLGAAVNALHLTAFSDEKKVQHFDTEVLTAMRGMFAPGKEYRFDMFAFTSVGSNSSGQIIQAIAISPGVASYAEWPALSALFDEVKLLKSRIEFIPQVGDNGQALEIGGSTPTLLANSANLCGANYTNISTAPASYSAVGRLARSAQVARTVGDLTGLRVFTLEQKKDLPFARTVTPAVQDPPAGVLGSFDIATDGPFLTASTYYYRVVLRTTVVLRNRA